MTLPVETIPETPAAVTQLPEENKPIAPKRKRASKHDFGDGHGRVLAKRHVNGKGWVADTAVVEASVYVGPRAQVFNNAYVHGKVRLEGRAKVFGRAIVSDEVAVKKDGEIGGQAVVRDQTLVTDNARIVGRCNVSGNTQLYGTSIIGDTAQVNASTLFERVHIGGAALVLRSHLSGGAQIDANSIVINSQVGGNVHVRGSAQILAGCSIRNYNASLATIIEGRALLADESHIWYSVHVKDHAVLLRCRLSHGFGSVDAAPVIEGNVVLQARNFGTRAELENFLTALRNMPVQQIGLAAAATNGVNTVPGFVPRQVNFLTSAPAPRRVQRLQEAGV